jgi:nuclear pore complex protein Nup54
MAFNFGSSSSGGGGGGGGFNFGPSNASNSSNNPFNFGSNNPNQSSSGGAAAGGFNFDFSKNNSGNNANSNNANSFFNPNLSTSSSSSSSSSVQSNSIEKRISSLRASYDPNNSNNRFQTIFYNNVDPNKINQFIKPPNANSKLWESAVKNNPDPVSLVPVLSVGFSDLKKRILEQDKASQGYLTALQGLSSSYNEMLSTHESRTKSLISDLRRIHSIQTHRLLLIMCKIELYRAANVHLLADELDFKRKLESIARRLTKPGQFISRIREIQNITRLIQERQNVENTQAINSNQVWSSIAANPQNLDNIYALLDTQRQSLQYITQITNKDHKILDTIINHTHTTSMQ